MRDGTEGHHTQTAAVRSEYLVDLNATQAAIRAGYSPKTANEQGTQLLAKVSIATAVAEKRAQQLQATDLSAVCVLEELRRLAFSNIQDLFDEHGNLTPIERLTAEETAGLASVEVLTKNLTAGDDQVDTVVKIRLWDKPRALELLAKHFALLTDVVKLETDEANIARLLAGRKRAAETSQTSESGSAPA